MGGNQWGIWPTTWRHSHNLKEVSSPTWPKFAVSPEFWSKWGCHVSESLNRRLKFVDPYVYDSKRPFFWHFLDEPSPGRCGKIHHGTDRDITLSTCSCLFIIYCCVLLYIIIDHKILYTGSFWSNSLWMQHDWQKHIFSCCSLGLLQAVNWFVAHSGQALLLLLMSQSQDWLENRTYLEPPLGFCLTKKTCSLYVDSLNCQMLDFPLGE